MVMAEMFSYNKNDKVRHLAVTPTREQKQEAQQSELYNDGDMVLVWVNEGDLLEANMEFVGKH
jgi:hypothetical protein